MTQNITTILSEDVFKAPQNFAHARIFNGLVYAAGQIPVDTSGKIVGTTIEKQTEQVIKNHASILKAAGSGLDQVLRFNVYLVEQADYNGFASVYAEFIPDPKPPRGCVFVKALPAGAKVEMDLVAVASSAEKL